MGWTPAACIAPRWGAFLPNTGGVWLVVDPQMDDQINRALGNWRPNPASWELIKGDIVTGKTNNIPLTDRSIIAERWRCDEEGCTWDEWGKLLASSWTVCTGRKVHPGNATQEGIKRVENNLEQKRTNSWWRDSIHRKNGKMKHRYDHCSGGQSACYSTNNTSVTRSPE